jgi:hypothetical protein
MNPGFGSNCLSDFKDLVLVVTAVIASYVALKGLSTWRRQLRGQSEYELAGRFLKSLFLFRDSLKNVRNPFSWHSNIPNLPKDQLDRLSENEKQWYATAQDFEKRWHRF